MSVCAVTDGFSLFQLTSGELTNGVINTAFLMLYKVSSLHTPEVKGILEADLLEADPCMYANVVQPCIEGYLLETSPCTLSMRL